jgi:hypothetical protein
MAEKGSGLAGDTMCLELGVKPEVAGRTKAVGPDLRKYIFRGSFVMSIYEKIDKMNERQLRSAAEKMAEVLAGDAAQMERWAFESQNYGWSTHQVKPMQRRAKVIRQGMSSVGIGI